MLQEEDFNFNSFSEVFKIVMKPLIGLIQVIDYWNNRQLT